MSKQMPTGLFELDDYRPYLRIWAEARGRGAYRGLSLALGMHTTLISQILSGRKNFTEEQAAKMTSHMGLNELESDYFIKLVQMERAGSPELKSHFRRHLEELRIKRNEVKSRVAESKVMSAEDQATFYSSWQYSLIRLLTSLRQYQTAPALAAKLKLSVSRVQEILDFLVSRGLCVERRGRFSRTQTNTHISAKSALSIRHHQNWRTRALEFHEHLHERDLAFTAPISLAEKDFARVRAIILDAIGEISKLVENSDSECVAYLGIDWLKV